MKILVVDDEVMNVELLQEYLASDGFDVVIAEDGEIGLEKLRGNPDVSVILLDKMMPNLNGIEFLERAKLDHGLKDIPVIMQTAAADEESILEGINAGIYYYLTKPYKKSILLSIVNAAINDTSRLKSAVDEVAKTKDTLGSLTRASFEFSTIQQAQHLANFIANSFPDPEKVILGLSEIMINAVEHGNLGIGYEEKTDLMASGKLTSEVEKRIKMPENVNKIVKAYFERKDNEVVIEVVDEGNGFDWKKFMELSPERAMEPNGRGIMMAKMMSFDSMEYNEKGNGVCCKVRLVESGIKTA